MRQNFTIVALEMWAEVRRNRQKYRIFLVINLPPRANPLKRFFKYKIWLGGLPYAKFSQILRCGFKNVGLPHKSPKLVLVW